MEKIKLIWDFRGPMSSGTAEHHAIHLGQFATKEGIKTYGHGHEHVDDQHAMAYMIVDRSDMIIVRDALRPDRAILA